LSSSSGSTSGSSATSGKLTEEAVVGPVAGDVDADVDAVEMYDGADACGVVGDKVRDDDVLRGVAACSCCC